MKCAHLGNPARKLHHNYACSIASHFLCRKKLIVWTSVHRCTKSSPRTSRWWDKWESCPIILKCWRVNRTFSFCSPGAAQWHQQRLEDAGCGARPRLLRPHSGNGAGGDQSLLPSHLQAIQSEHRHGNTQTLFASLCSMSVTLWHFFTIWGFYFHRNVLSAKCWNGSVCFIVFVTSTPSGG